jgi:cytochrome P450
MPPDRQVPFLDLADPAFSVRSAQVRQAREAGWWARTSFGLAVLRHAQAERLLAHPALRQGSVAWPAHHGITSGPFARWWYSWMLNKEGAEHRRLRRAVNPAFSRRFTDRLTPRFAELATELAAGFAGTGRCEFMSEFAVPYTARSVCLLLGIPAEQWRAVAADAATVGLALGVTIAEHLPRIEAALTALLELADTVIADRRSHPRDDIVTSLALATGPEVLTGEELRDVLALLIFGGFDTTRNQLGLALHLFASHPGQWRLLAERAELAPAAVEEVMRVRPTTTWVTREAAEDLAIDGLEIRRGTTIHILAESAGTDPHGVPDAAFDITAPARPGHFGFGGGIHYCLGHLVARAEMRQALAVLPPLMREPRLLEGAVFLPDSGNTGPVRLPLAFTPPAAPTGEGRRI